MLKRLPLIHGFFLLQFATAQPIHDFFKETFEERLRDYPEFATTIGRHDYDDRWTDWSKSGRAQRRAHIERRLERLNGFPAASLSGQDRLTVRLLQYEFRSLLEAEDLETHLLRVGQLEGLHNQVYIAVDNMPARTIRDYENLVARVKAIPAYVDQNVAILDESIARGIMQPRVVRELVAEQLAAQIGQSPDSTALLAAFR